MNNANNDNNNNNIKDINENNVETNEKINIIEDYFAQNYNTSKYLKKMKRIILLII